MTQTSKKRKLTNHDLNMIVLRELPLEASWHYERQQHLGFCYSIQSALKKIYEGQPEKYIDALKRHTGEFYNTSPQATPFICSLVCSMEEEYAADDSFDVSSISAIKAALIGPFAGIFDAIFLSTLRIIGTAVGTSLCMQGSFLGPIAYWAIYNIPAFICRFVGVRWGYYEGAELIQELQESGAIGKFKDAAALVAMMAFGWMTKNYVAINFVYEFGPEGGTTTIQAILDSIIPGLASLGLVWLFWWLLTKKKVNFMIVLLFTLLASILGVTLGIVG